jgi:hypothetical protein
VRTQTETTSSCVSFVRAHLLSQGMLRPRSCSRASTDKGMTKTVAPASLLLPLLLLLSTRAVEGCESRWPGSRACGDPQAGPVLGGIDVVDLRHHWDR